MIQYAATFSSILIAVLVLASGFSMTRPTKRASIPISPKLDDHRVGLVYALPVMALSFLYGPSGAILQGIYAKHFGLTLTTIATVLLISRLFDALSDPIIGYCADRYHARHGTRKPFVVGGGLLFIFASWFLYVPPVNVSPIYFLVCFLAFYFAYTLFEIPHLAWGSELSIDSEDKNRIYGWRSCCWFIGGLFFYAIPLLPLFKTNEFTPETLKWSVLVAIVMMLPMLYMSIRFVPDHQSIQTHGSVVSYKKESIVLLLQTILRNKPLLILTAAHTCTGFGSGMWFTLLFIFVDSYLGLGHQFALVYVTSFGLSILALRIWYKLALKLGKQCTWWVAMVLVALGMIGTGLLSSASADWLSLLVCMSLIYSGFAAFSIMVPSLMSDISDYGTLKFGTDRTALYFALYTLINKTVGALGGALGLGLAGWFGFDPTMSSHSNTAILGLRISIAWIPAAMILTSIFFITRIPITVKRHEIIRRRLAARNDRAAR